MNALLRNRGLVSAAYNSPQSQDAEVAAVFSELRDTVNDFKKRHNSELSAVTNAVDEMNAQINALRVGGSGGDISSSAGRKANAAVVEFLRTGRPDAMQALNPKAAMSTDSGPDGGYTVPQEIDKNIQSTMLPYSPMRRLARVITVNTSDYHMLINRRGATTGWVGETDDRPDTNTPTLRDIVPPQGEIYARPAITQWALDDSEFNLAGFIQENVVDEMAVQENIAFVMGSGSKKPLGFLSVPITDQDDDARPSGTYQFLKSGNANGFKAPTDGPADILFDMVHKLKAGYRAGPGVAWQMNSMTAGIIRKFRDIGGNYLWADLDAEGLRGNNLAGYPVEINEDMPDIGANAYPIAFGNWNKGYVIVDRIGIRILRDPYTKPGWVKFYITKRVGGSPADTNAIKFLKIAA